MLEWLVLGLLYITVIVLCIVVFAYIFAPTFSLSLLCGVFVVAVYVCFLLFVALVFDLCFCLEFAVVWFLSGCSFVCCLLIVVKVFVVYVFVCI